MTLARVTKEKKNIRRQVWYLGVAAIFTCAAYISIFSLQSSINIEADLGTTSLAVTYSVNAVWNLFFSSSILKWLGPKKALLIGDVFYIAYTLANIYPTYATLISAAVLIGIANGMTWPSFPLYIAYFGRQYASKTCCYDRKGSLLEDEDKLKAVKTPEKSQADKFAGLFYSIFSAYLLVGNLISFAILKIGDTDKEPERNWNTTSVNLTDEQKFSSCGASQLISSTEIPEVNDEIDLNRYQITNWGSRLGLFLALAFLQVVAGGIHAFLLRNTPKPIKQEINGNELELTTIVHGNPRQDHNNEGNVKQLRKTRRFNPSFTDVFRHLANLQSLLIIPLTFYSGMANAFIFADFTRAYVTCVSGVSQLGLVMCVLAVAEIISCYIFKRLVSKLGLNFFWIVTLVLDAGGLVFALLWQPNSQTLWLSYVLAFAIGLPDGLRQSVLMATYVQYFETRGEAAFSSLPLIYGLGCSFSYGSNRFMSVQSKIYSLFVAMALGLFCYVLAELHYRQTKKSVQK